MYHHWFGPSFWVCLQLKPTILSPESDAVLREMSSRNDFERNIFDRNIFNLREKYIQKISELIHQETGWYGPKCTMCSAVHHTSGKNIGFQWGASWPIVWHFKITRHFNGVKWNFCMTMTSLQNLDWLAIFLIRFKLVTNPEITGFMFKICLASSDSRNIWPFF